MTKPVYDSIVRRDDDAIAAIRTDNVPAFASFLRALADELDPASFKPHRPPTVAYRSALGTGSAQDDLEVK